MNDLNIGAELSKDVVTLAREIFQSSMSPATMGRYLSGLARQGDLDIFRAAVVHDLIPPDTHRRPVVAYSIAHLPASVPESHVSFARQITAAWLRMAKADSPVAMADYLARCGQARKVRALMDIGADPCQVTSDGTTALEQALSSHGSVSSARAMLDHCMSTGRLPMSLKRTPIMHQWATDPGEARAAVDALVKYVVKTPLPEEWRRAFGEALAAAAAKSDPLTEGVLASRHLHMLSATQASPHEWRRIFEGGQVARNVIGATDQELAAGVIGAMARDGVDLDAIRCKMIGDSDTVECTLLHLACRWDMASLATTLIEHGADPHRIFVLDGAEQTAFSVSPAGSATAALLASLNARRAMRDAMRRPRYQELGR